MIPRRSRRPLGSLDRDPRPDPAEDPSRLAGVLGDPDLTAGPVDRAGPLAHVYLGRALPGQCLLQLALGLLRVDHGCRDGPVGQHGHDVVTDLREPAVDEITPVRAARLGPEFAVS